MTAAYYHLILNHIPVVGVGFGFLIFIIAIFKKSNEFIKASLIIFLVSALVTIPTYLTGEDAAHAIKNMQFVSANLIGPHARVAFLTLIIVEVLGAVSLLGLILSRGKSVPRWIVNLVLVLSIVAGGAVTFTANLGGMIHHPEVQPGFNKSIP